MVTIKARVSDDFWSMAASLVDIPETPVSIFPALVANDFNLLFALLNVPADIPDDCLPTKMPSSSSS
jgi:hypothetical protein